VNPVFVSPDGIGVVVGTVVLSTVSSLFEVGRSVSVGVVDNNGEYVLTSGLCREGWSVVVGAAEEVGSSIVNPILVGTDDRTTVGHDVSVGAGEIDGPRVLPSYTKGFGDAVGAGDNGGVGTFGNSLLSSTN
jgi:hypothetical protein